MNARVLLNVGILAVAFAACSKEKPEADDSMKMAADSMAAMKTDTAKPAPAPLNDANLVAIYDAANAADSANGAVAAKKGTSADVRKFAQTMMRDHHALRVKGQALAKKLNVTPEPPPNSAAMMAHQDSVMATENNTAKGAAWDKWYIDNEVTYHQNVLSTLQTAEGVAQNAELKALITSTIPGVQSHLKMAQDLQGKMK